MYSNIMIMLKKAYIIFSIQISMLSSFISNLPFYLPFYLSFYLSFIFGKLIRIFSLDEIKQNKKEIILGKDTLLILISLMFVPLANVLSLISIMFFILFRKITSQYFIYFMFGFIIFLSYFSGLKIVIASLVSLLVILHSSLENFKLKSFVIYSIFFSLPFSLVFIETFINANLSIFIGLAIAGLLAQLRGP